MTETKTGLEVQETHKHDHDHANCDHDHSADHDAKAPVKLTQEVDIKDAGPCKSTLKFPLAGQISNPEWTTISKQWLQIQA